MIKKLAFKNTSKHIKDYLVYFLTLTFAVSVFYMFNSIESQREMLILSDVRFEALKMINQLMGYVSVFVSFILVFLIVYANNFLIARRKKEFGLYLTLGLKKTDISKLLILETMVIAFFALSSGLLTGVILSQAMTVFTAKLFQTQIHAFRFIVSHSAAIKTLIYFGLTFVLVVMINVFKISKFRLITLLYGNRLSERPLLNHPFAFFLCFFSALAMLISAYWLVLKFNLIPFSTQSQAAIALGILGTFLFFFAFANGLEWLAKKFSKWYHKGINSFVIKQVSSKINTNFVTLSLITLLLLFAMGTFASGIGLGNALSSELEKNTPYDFSVVTYMNNGTLGQSPLDLLIKQLPELSLVHETLLYSLPTRYQEVLEPDFIKANHLLPEMNFEAISLSHYNALALDQGAPSFDLSHEEALLLIKSPSQTLEFSLSGLTLSVIEQIQTLKLYNDNISLNHPTLVLNDAHFEGLIPKVSYVNANGLNLQQFIDLGLSPKSDEESYFSVFYVKEAIIEEAIGSKAALSYIAIYIGLIFIFTCAAVLSLQQLTEMADQKSRYDMLQKLGVDGKMIRSAVFKQLLIYFMLPLVLALVHTFVGLTVVGRIIEIFGNFSVFKHLLTTVFFLLILYLTYFAATFYTVQNIIKKAHAD